MILRLSGYLLFGLLLFSTCAYPPLQSKKGEKNEVAAIPFGEGRQLNMVYDRRQGPAAILLQDKVHIVFNGGTEISKKAKPMARPMAITYDLQRRTFSDAFPLGPGSTDHHDGPVIWTDPQQHFHILFGCHKSPGTHLISRSPSSLGESANDWQTGLKIAPSISYPSFHKISRQRQLVYYRTAGHISSWTYGITSDSGKTWEGPPQVVTDLDSKGRLDWSSYHTVLPGSDGKFLHVAFTAYDDNRSKEEKRFYNPRYQHHVSNEWKYNLYYLKIDLTSHTVFNAAGIPLQTPIDIEQADSTCRIWDTEWRGAGIPPDIVLDEAGEPSFLHVLSGETTQAHTYYYVHQVAGEWQQTPIITSNHQWNSSHIQRDSTGKLHAWLIRGEGYFESDRYLDKHGGGRIEEWISDDQGNTWQYLSNPSPNPSTYPGWKYNNIQPVIRPDGSIVPGMILFYGWGPGAQTQTRGFLIHRPE